MTGTTGSLRLVGHGLAELPAGVDLQSTASGAWTPTGLQVDLPAAGTYQLDASVRVALTGTSPVNAFIAGRLFDVSGGAVVPASETIIYQIHPGSSAGTISLGGNATSPIQTEYTVAGPATIRVEAARFNAVGSSTAAAVHSNQHGRTTLRYMRVG